RSPEELGPKLARTTAPRFGRYILDDRIIFLGESNNDWTFWGPRADYWTERQAFLLGAKFDAIHVNENGKLDGPEDRALGLAITARDGVGWGARTPTYLDQRGLSDIPSGIDVRRFRGKDGEDLLVFDNWHVLQDKSVTFRGQSVPVP